MICVVSALNFVAEGPQRMNRGPPEPHETEMSERLFGNDNVYEFERGRAITKTRLSGKIVRENHGGVQVLNYKVRPQNLYSALRTSAEKYAEKTVFECHSATVTYEEFLADVEGLATAMQNVLGVKKGDRVALMLGNDYAFPLTFFATITIGAVAVPINTRLVAKEIAYILKNSSARVAFVDPANWRECSRARGSANALEHAVLTQPIAESSRCLLLDDLLRQSTDELSPVEVIEDDLAAIFYTSDTTGNPLGAMCTHRNFVSNAINTHTAVGSNPDGRGLICVPLCHPTACHSQMISTVYLGATAVILRRFNAAETLQAVEMAKVTTLVGVPTIYWLLLAQMKLQDYDLSSLRNIMYGGAPASPELVRNLREAFPSVRLGNGYGLSESSALATFLPDEYAMEKPDSVGPPVPTVEIRVVGEDGANLTPGRIGEVLLKGPNIVDGYWREPEATKATFVDGWCHTGDLGRIDGEGFLYIVDRKKDMIIRGGENIYCVEIENVLESHPAVFDAAVVGKPDKVFGEQVMAFVVLNPGAELTVDEIHDYCDDHLADFKVPKYIEFIDQLPRNIAGKMDKTLLKE
jgi:acyl-CoA synthetase (AMP-forming)/AMP-acid ligase II